MSIINQLEEKLKAKIKKEGGVRFLVFLAIVIVSFVCANFFTQYFLKIEFVVLGIELTILILAMWALAGHAVMKSFFLVGAYLSLLIFLAKSYCELPAIAQTSKTALESILSVGIFYITINFLYSLYKEMVNRTKTLKEINDRKKPWFLFTLFALFVGLLVYQIYQVISPIILNLCVYKH